MRIRHLHIAYILIIWVLPLLLELKSSASHRITHFNWIETCCVYPFAFAKQQLYSNICWHDAHSTLFHIIWIFLTKNWQDKMSEIWSTNAFICCSIWDSFRVSLHSMEFLKSKESETFEKMKKIEIMNEDQL